MKKLIFSGCSFTAGNGWVDLPTEKSQGLENKQSPYLWVNLCAQGIDSFKNLELINAGVGGASNTEIFEKTVELMSLHGDNIDTVVCQWTSLQRYNFQSKFEDVPSYNGPYINELLQKLLAMHHLHWEVLKIVKYSNILKKLANKLKINRVIFINGVCPWDNNYFEYLNEPISTYYTNFTKNEILNIQSRSEEDIVKLYKLAHQHYQEAGGINSGDWVNLYNSFHNSAVDFNFDQIHPGIKSNQLYFQQVNNFINQ